MTMSRRDRNYTFVGIMLALFLGAIDQTIVSTALPKIVEDLGGLERYAWVFTAYMVASTVLVPVYGKLADMYSRKTISLGAVAVFLTGSFLCGLAGEFGPLPLLGDGMNQLIVFRAIQGMGAAGLFSLAFIVIADLFPPAERGRYQGIVSATFGIASILGPLLGGFLTDNATGIIPGVAGWRWVFYVNVPFGALAVWFIATRMPPLLPRGERGRLDLPAAVLLLAGLVPLVTVLQLDRAEHPWTSPLTIGILAWSVAMLALFVWRSLKSPNPILDLTLFRNKVFRSSNMALFFFGASFLSAVAFLPLYVVNVVGMSATGAGMALVPLSLAVVFGSMMSGQLVSRYGRYRLIMLVGTAILIVGIFLLTRLTPDSTLREVTLYMVVVGLGLGPSGPLYTLAVQNAVDVRRMGQATSATQFFRQIGGAVGTAVLGSVLATTLAFGFNQHLGELGTLITASTGGESISASGDVISQIEAAYGGPLPDGVREQVVAGVKLSFTDAITTVYKYVLGMAILAFMLTWFIPVLPLRKTFEGGSQEAKG